MAKKSTETSKLKLFKYDTVADGHQTFNIEKALNENWDKIDDAVSTLESEVKSIDLTPVSNKITTEHEATRNLIQSEHATTKNAVMDQLQVLADMLKKLEPAYVKPSMTPTCTFKHTVTSFHESFNYIRGGEFYIPADGQIKIVIKYKKVRGTSDYQSGGRHKLAASLIPIKMLPVNYFCYGSSDQDWINIPLGGTIYSNGDFDQYMNYYYGLIDTIQITTNQIGDVFTETILVCVSKGMHRIYFRPQHEENKPTFDLELDYSIYYEPVSAY